MIKTIIAVTMTVSSMTAYATDPVKDVNAAQRVATQVVTSLQQESAYQYAALYPSIEGFKRMMDETKTLYKENLDAAKEDFESRYLTEIVPALNESFEALLQKGREAGIDWKTAKLTNAKLLNNADRSIEMTVNASGKEFRILLEKTLLMEGQLRVTQFVSIK